MFLNRALHSSTCASCRLRASIAAKQLARTRRVGLKAPSRFLSTAERLRVDETTSTTSLPHGQTNVPSIKNVVEERNLDDAALFARQTFGDALPDGLLNEEEYKVYERLYGKPLKYEERTETLQENLVEGEELDAGTGTGVLKEAEDGVLEEVEFEVDEAIEDDDGDINLQEHSFNRTSADTRLAEDIRATLSDPGIEDTISNEFTEDSEAYFRTHPLTLAARFTTSPSTLSLPTTTLTEPITNILTSTSNTHLTQSAQRLFGGLGLPHSTSTPTFGKRLQQKPIPLSASQNQMSEIEGDVFLATLWPGIYASVMSVLVETRKRLGSDWAEDLVKKAQRGELRILDAGSGGVAVIAFREVLKAEWERMHENDPMLGSSVALAETDGRIGGASASPPLGHATVLTSSDMLRRRAAKLLENTTFIPRLPDYVHATEMKREGKFDIVLAPHTLWELREDYLRKSHVENLWSLLKQDSGVLVLLEKGVARGFEVLALARQHILDQRIRSSSSDHHSEHNESGTIIAPCTNHTCCPMYKPQGMLKGRRDICHFSQRYVRPPFLQKILGAKDKNFEDVEFSYLSVMRGRDLRSEGAIEQGEVATLRAFEGLEEVDGHLNESLDVSVGTETKNGLSALEMPRAILPPLKRRGHVILDLCTPMGTLERWTVPRSFSKQAFRDARKSSWGDLWALGAKSRVMRVPRGRKRREGDDVVVDLDVKVVRRKGKARRRNAGKKGMRVD